MLTSTVSGWRNSMDGEEHHSNPGLQAQCTALEEQTLMLRAEIECLRADGRCIGRGHAELLGWVQFLRLREYHAVRRSNEEILQLMDQLLEIEDDRDSLRTEVERLSVGVSLL